MSLMRPFKDLPDLIMSMAIPRTTKMMSPQTLKLIKKRTTAKGYSTMRTMRT